MAQHRRCEAVYATARIVTADRIAFNEQIASRSRRVTRTIPAWAVSVRRLHAPRATCAGRRPKTFTLSAVALFMQLPASLAVF
jgi:hypothetical protein